MDNDFTKIVLDTASLRKIVLKYILGIIILSIFGELRHLISFVRVSGPR